MKHFILLPTSFLTVLLLCSCGGNSDNDNSADDVLHETATPLPTMTPTPETPTPPPTATPTPTPPPVSGNVTVEFKISIPEDTPTDASIYISGDFENWSGGTTSSNTYLAQPSADGFRYLTLDFEEDQVIQYKFTRGNWSTVETGPNGNTIINRIHKLSADTTIDIDIESWDDLAEPVNEVFWETSPPDYSQNSNRPVITLLGSDITYLSLGNEYIEPGATADDPQDGDISPFIDIISLVDTSTAGDYLVRYSVEDSQGLDAIEKVRIVRVYDDQPVRQSLRPVGTTASHLGYIEHLPPNYGENVDEVFPLIISNHGGGANANFIGGTADSSLASMIYGEGLAYHIWSYEWDNTLPFIVLSPQRSFINSNLDIERLEAFLDFALHTYRVDTNRIYMTGWSQGSHASLRFANQNPGMLAAIVPVSGGFLRDFPDNVCPLASTPIWAFHGDNDSVVNVSSSETAINAINQCDGAQTRFTRLQGQTHFIQNDVFTDRLIEFADPSYTPFDQSIFEWMLIHTR